MLGFFSAKCPIPDESRQWVERRTGWVCQVFGDQSLLQARAILPTVEFFPDEYNGSDDCAKRMFDRVCEFVGIDRQRVEIQFVTARPDSRGGALFIQTEGVGAAGTYQNAGARQVITIERAALREPMKLVATMAHELCHVHLLGDARISGEEEDHEPLTDLLTVCRGMGIFGANASAQYSAWSEGGRYGWRTSSLGYLRQDTWAYALGLFAHLRGESRPAWAKHLRADVRSVFFRSLRYLAKHGAGEASARQAV